MSSWSRRVSVATARPTVAGRARTGADAELLAGAVADGVSDADQAALLALAHVAREHEGFRTTLLVQADREGGSVDLTYEIASVKSGVVIRLVGGPGVGVGRPLVSGPADSEVELVDDEDELDGEQVRTILTDTLVETPDMVAVFASVGREALWANDAFVTLIPIREADKIWLVELLDEWSKGHYEVKVLPALVKFGRWRGRLTFVSDDGPGAGVGGHRGPPRPPAARSCRCRWWPATCSELRDGRGATSTATETRFAALVENAADLIVVVDPDGIIQLPQPGGHPHPRLRRGRARRRRPARRSSTPTTSPTDLLALAQPDEQGIGSPVELRLRTSDGSWRHLEVDRHRPDRQPGHRRHRAQRPRRHRAGRGGAAAGRPGVHRSAHRPAQPGAAPRPAGHGRSTRPPAPTPVGRHGVRHRPVQARSTRVVGRGRRRQRAAGGGRPPAGGRGRAGDVGPPRRRRRSSSCCRARPTWPRRSRLANRIRAGRRRADRGRRPERRAEPERRHRRGRARRRARRLLVDAASGPWPGPSRTAAIAPRCSTTAMAEADSRRQTDRAAAPPGPRARRLRVHFQPIVDIETEQVVGGRGAAAGARRRGRAALAGRVHRGGRVERAHLPARAAGAPDHLRAAGGLGRDRPARRAPCRAVGQRVAPPARRPRPARARSQEVLVATGVEPARLCLEITESILIGAEPTVDASISYLRVARRAHRARRLRRPASRRSATSSGSRSTS